jgi:hypothetical protein
MFKKRGNKGLSTIVSTLIIILLILIAIVLVWVVVRTVLQKNAEKIELNELTLDLKIERVNLDGNDLSVTLKRNPGEGDFVGLNFIVEDDENSESFRVNKTMNELEINVFTFTLASVNPYDIKNVKVYPIFKTESGKEITGDVKDTWEKGFSPIPQCIPSCPLGAQCGSNGCGGTCGEGCSGLTPICSNYQCTAEPCVGSCFGKECGNNGCGESCGSCLNEHGTTLCNSSFLCEPSCLVLWGNCDGNRINGCETPLTSNYNCGGCGVVCNSTQTCVSGTCVTSCTSHATSNCTNGDVYWWNSCGQIEGIRYDCNSTQTCVSGTCVNNPTGTCNGVTCGSNEYCFNNQVCLLSVSGKTYFLSPTGSDSTGNGSINNPWFTLNKAWTVVSAGDIVYMRGGDYDYTSRQYLTGKSGTSGNLINIYAYGNEVPNITELTTFTRGTGAVIYFVGNYVHWKGIHISGYPQTYTDEMTFAFRVQNSSHNIFEQIVIHDCGFGMHIGGMSDDNLILNCDIYNIYDPYSTSVVGGVSVPNPYEDGDGFSIGYDNAGTFNTFRGCRAWNIADDGWDLWKNDGEVLIENCWTWKCGYAEDGISEGGNGQGFKFGISNTMGTNVLVTAKNTVSCYNRESGYHQNGMLHPVALYNNIAYSNGAQGFWFGGWETQPYSYSINHTLTNNLEYKNRYKSYLTTGSKLTTNTFLVNGNNNTNYFVTDADFTSLDQSQLLRPRKSDGSLPDIDFLHLISGSDLINVGTNVGLPYSGSAPDIGAFEYN